MHINIKNHSNVFDVSGYIDYIVVDVIGCIEYIVVDVETLFQKCLM